MHLLYTYFNRKRRLHVNFHRLEILTLIREKIKIIHQYHYNLFVKNNLHKIYYISAFY
jgi:hypothetical protein